MIRVLVMANESLLADFIVSNLSQEPELEVFQVTRDEMGTKRDYSVVIVVDEEMDGNESLRFREFIRKGAPLLLMRVSLKDRIVSIDESYQLINPGMKQVIDILKEFDRKIDPKSGTVLSVQKKMNRSRLAHAEQYGRQQARLSPGRHFDAARSMSPQPLAVHLGGPYQSELPLFFSASFFASLYRTEKSKKRDAVGLAAIHYRKSLMKGR